MGVAIIFVHGMGGGSDTFRIVMHQINTLNPHRRAIVYDDYYTGIHSLLALEPQLESLEQFILNDISKHPFAYSEGFDLVGYSVGGVLCTVLCTRWPEWDKFPIKRLVTVASPLNGLYGPVFPFSWHFLYENIGYLLNYSLFQRKLGIANMWRDPHHNRDFETFNLFLAKNMGFIDDGLRGIRAQNILKLERVVIVGSRDDGVIFPYQSSLLGWWTSNSVGLPKVGPYQFPVDNLKESSVAEQSDRASYYFDIFKEYTNDDELVMTSFPGSQIDGVGIPWLELHNSNRLQINEYQGIGHSDWFSDPRIIWTYIMPHIMRGECTLEPYSEYTLGGVHSVSSMTYWILAVFCLTSFISALNMIHKKISIIATNKEKEPLLATP